MNKLQRHYIFIDPNNINDNLKDNLILNEIKKIHINHYTNNEIITYWSYNDIVNLLFKYDVELCKLFKCLNYNYPAFLADIGRYIILFYYGGIYHDLKCISNKKIINYLDTTSNNITFIA